MHTLIRLVLTAGLFFAHFPLASGAAGFFWKNLPLAADGTAANFARELRAMEDTDEQTYRNFCATMETDREAHSLLPQLDAIMRRHGLSVDREFHEGVIVRRTLLFRELAPPHKSYYVSFTECNSAQ